MLAGRAALTLLPALAAALSTPPPRANAATRRVVLETAASATVLPLLVSPGSAAARLGDDSAIGFNGALRNDIGPTIYGDGVEVLITDQSYRELSACPKEFFVPTKEGPWTCLEISVTATNNGRRKQTTAIDVFGLLFDTEGFSCLSTSLSADVKGSPVASVEVNIPKGESRQLKFYAAVQSRSPRPFRFGGWKGSYRNAGIAKVFQTFDPCEIDSSACDDFLDQPDNAAKGYLGEGFKYGNSK